MLKTLFKTSLLLSCMSCVYAPHKGKGKGNRHKKTSSANYSPSKSRRSPIFAEMKSAVSSYEQKKALDPARATTPTSK